MKAKFKDTEIGMIPEDWEVKRLGDCLEIVKKQFKPTKSDIRRYIGLEHIEQQSLKLISIGSSADVGSNKFEFKKDQILFGKLRPYFRKVYQPNFDGVCSTDMWVIGTKDGNDNSFFFYFLADERIINEANNSSEGTRMPRARWDYLEKLEYPIPTLNEQHRIAKILSDFDSKIKLLQKQNKTLEAIAQALFKHWFVDSEFPNEKGKPYKSSGGEMVFNDELGKEIAKGWGVKPLDQIANFLNGLALQKFPPEGDDFLPVIKIKELRQGITEQSDKASPNIDKKYVINDGDVLFSWSGTLMVVIWGEGKGALNQHLFKVTSDDFEKWFYYYWIKNHLRKFIGIAKDKTTTMGHIKRHHLTDSKVLVPNDVILERMNEIMNSFIYKKIKNKLELRMLISLRDSLLPKLMSGEIRINILEAGTE